MSVSDKHWFTWIYSDTMEHNYVCGFTKLFHLRKHVCPFGSHITFGNLLHTIEIQFSLELGKFNSSLSLQWWGGSNLSCSLDAYEGNAKKSYLDLISNLT